MGKITAHCLIKNEENFIEKSVESVLEFVDKIIIFDTGSIDKTVEIVKKMAGKYPEKIIFEEKGLRDKKGHTELRNEMIAKTATDWFMVLDGDEVWTKRAMSEAVQIINSEKAECILAPFYLCVGDVYHAYFKKGSFHMLDRVGNITVRFFKNVRRIHWVGIYESDSLFDSENKIFFTKENSIFLKNKFWHLTHLKRSSVQNDFSSGGTRKNKVIPTYFILGRKIREMVPEVFADQSALRGLKSFFRFWPFALRKIYERVKSVFLEIKIPTGWSLALILLSLLIYMFGSAFVLNGDGSYGYAITQRMTDPQAFAYNDLPVVGGVNGNFLFYKLLHYIPFFQNDFVKSDFLISSVISLLLVLAWYNIFSELTNKKFVIIGAVFLMIFVDSRLSIGGTTIPLFYLTSFSSLHFLQIFGLYFFVKKRYILSFVLISLTAFFHPASSIFFLGILGSVLLINSIKTKNYSQLFKPCIAALVILVPNLLFVNKTLGSTGDSENFFRIFYNLNGLGYGHIYAENYPWQYAFTLVAFLLLLIFYYKKLFDFQHKKIIFQIFSIMFLFLGFWLINIYYVHIVQLLYLSWAMRVTYIVKPLFSFLFVLAAFSLVERDNILSKLVAVLLIFSLAVPSFPVAVGILCLLILFFIFNLDKTKTAEKINSFLKQISDKVIVKNKTLFIGILLFILAAVAVLSVYRYNSKVIKLYKLSRGENTFNFNFDINKNYGLDKSDPPFGELLHWAKGFKGKMFITPINDCRFSGAFRFLTKNSIYTNICDMFQNQYLPKEFFEGYDRMLQLNFKIIRRGVFNYTDYNKLELSYLRKMDADYVVFLKNSEGYMEKPDKPIFENSEFIIYQLR